MSALMKRHATSTPTTAGIVAASVVSARRSRDGRNDLRGIGPIGRLRARLVRQRDRRLRSIQLVRMSDHELADIGVVRDEVEMSHDSLWRRRA